MARAYFSIGFSKGEELLVPSRSADSGWGHGQLRGMAISGALARAAEKVMTGLERPELVPARWSVDLFRAVAPEPVSVRAAIVRVGGRLCLIDAVMEQDGKDVSRASALYVDGGREEAAAVWSRPIAIEPPARDLKPLHDEPRLCFSEGLGWTGNSDGHRIAARKQTWHFSSPIVEGENPTSFQFAASAADIASVVSNWGEGGLAYINADLSVSFSRLPSSDELGIAAVDRVEAKGVAAGSAYLYDRAGVFGLATVSSIRTSRYHAPGRQVV